MMLRAASALLLALFRVVFFRVLFGLFSALIFSISSGLEMTELLPLPLPPSPPPLLLLLV